MGFSNIDKKTGTADIFIIIGENKFRRKGLGMEALKYLLKYGFTKLKLKKINLEVNKKNKPAIELYKKFGFKKVARIPRQLQHKGALLDEVVMMREL